jgi:ATP-binding cassette subfamily B protein
VTKDVDKVQEFLTEDVVETAASALKLVGMLGILYWLDWQLSLALTAFLPLFLVAISLYRRRIKQAEGRVRRKEGDISSLAQEALTSIRLVKSYGREQFEEARFEAHSGEALDAGLQVSRAEAAFASVVEVLSAVALAGLVWLGAQRVLSGSLTPGGLLVFIAYFRDFYEPTRSLAKLSGRLSKVSVRAEKIAAVLHEVPTIQDQPDARPAPPLRGQIQFERVSFSYAPGQPVLSDISFEVQPGQVVALVGATGAGKSTLAGLVPRLYDPTAGRVLLDGQDLRTFTLASLQAQISVVLQGALLFRATVRENIAYGRPRARFEEIVAAAKAANAHDFILRLPDGYNTVIGERGDTLSGGQRQRIAIARALVRNTPLLILDEPTTGLDAKAEQVVLEALEHLMAGRTTLVIAHKLSTIRRADSILVLSHGRIVERGTHRELLALGGMYAELYRLQVLA